jgi:hypothetical protein
VEWIGVIDRNTALAGYHFGPVTAFLGAGVDVFSIPLCGPLGCYRETGAGLGMHAEGQLKMKNSPITLSWNVHGTQIAGFAWQGVSLSCGADARYSW